MNCPHAPPGSPPCLDCVHFRDRAVDVALANVEAVGLIVAQLASCAHSAALEHSTWCVLCGATRVREHEWLRPALAEWSKLLDVEPEVADRPPGPPVSDSEPKKMH